MIVVENYTGPGMQLKCNFVIRNTRVPPLAHKRKPVLRGDLIFIRSTLFPVW